MRLPLSAEMTMQYSESGTPMTARSTWANEQFNAMMNTRIEQSVLELGDAIKSLDLTQFLKEAA